MKGDLYIDFAVAIFLFVFAFVLIFYYFTSQTDLKIQTEKMQTAKLKIQNLFDSLPKELVEKRIILVPGSGTNEFINLSNYDIDLILDENNNVICFDKNLKGFVANVSNSKFYLYSTKADITKKTCEIQNFSDRMEEKISSPIYEEFFINLPKTNKTGNYCDIKPILIFSGNGLKKEKIKICIN